MPGARQAPWLVRHRRIVLATLILAAIAVRGVYLGQITGTPYAALHQWTQSDMHAYDRWARRIAEGDVLSRHVSVPMHAWHWQVAETYLDARPDRRPATTEATPPGPDQDPHARLWAEWMRAPAFYQDGLYAYLVATSYRLFGQTVTPVFLGQSAAGVLALVVVWSLTRRFFGDTVAAVSAALALLCGPLLYYEAMLLRESAIVAAGLLAVWCGTRALDRPAWWRFALTGLALGLGVLLKSSLLVLACGLPAGIAVIYRGRRREGVHPLAAVALGLLVGVLPLLARNVALGLSPVTLAASGPLTLVAGNHAGYDATSGFAIDAPVMARFLGETDGGWSAAVRTALADHSVTSFATLLWQKWAAAWHWREIANNENYHYLASQVPILRWLPVTAFAIAPLGLVGLALAAPRWRRVWPLHLLVASALVPLVLFYVLGRFRIALLAALLPFAALAVVEVFRALRRGRQARAAWLVAAIAGVWCWTGRPVPAGDPLIRTADYLLTYSARTEPEILAALDRQDLRAAASACGRYLEAEAPTEADVRAIGSPDLAQALARMNQQCAGLWHRTGDLPRATRHLDRAGRLSQILKGS